MSDLTPIPPNQPQTTPPGWYAYAPGVQRYWDGQAWTDHVAAAPVPQQPQMMVQQTGPMQVQMQPMHVSGLTTGQHIFHGILTVCTCGFWGPVWAWLAFSGRRRIS